MESEEEGYARIVGQKVNGSEQTSRPVIKACLFFGIFLLIFVVCEVTSGCSKSSPFIVELPNEFKFNTFISSQTRAAQTSYRTVPSSQNTFKSSFPESVRIHLHIIL